MGTKYYYGLYTVSQNGIVVRKNGYTGFHCRQHVHHGTNSLTKTLETWTLFHKEILSFLLIWSLYFAPFLEINHFGLSHFSFFFNISSHLPLSDGNKVSGIVWGIQSPFENDTTSALLKVKTVLLSQHCRTVKY